MATAGPSNQNGLVAPRKRVRLPMEGSRLSEALGYEAAPANLALWISGSTGTLMTSTSEAGRRCAAHNIKLVPLAEICASDCGVVALDIPDDGESRDCDFISTSNVAFFEFIGAPGVFMHIKVLGTLESSAAGAELIGRRFALTSPACAPHISVPPRWSKSSKFQ